MKHTCYPCIKQGNCGDLSSKEFNYFIYYHSAAILTDVITDSGIIIIIVIIYLLLLFIFCSIVLFVIMFVCQHLWPAEPSGSGGRMH